MHVGEANRTRHAVVKIDQGEELPGALDRALDRAEVRAGWITGAGALEAAELVVVDPATHERTRTRRLDGATEVASLSGRVFTTEGVTQVRLWVTLARETDSGMSVCAGELVWGRASALDLLVIALDDAAVARDLTPAREVPIVREVAPAREERVAPRVEPTPNLARAAQTSAGDAPPVVPQKPARPPEDDATYPEVGDRVMHFHFGECEIIVSDGDRIRLRQERDGRVREVALSMLRVDPPTTDADGRRHFELKRKN